MKGFLIIGFILAISIGSINGQCTFDPIITGDILACPNETEGTIYSNPADADGYQWYKRSFSGGTSEVIPGAIDNSLELVYFDDLLFYFSVDVTIAGCTEKSDEVLIDGWAFLLPSVTQTGDYTTDGSGNFLICEGEAIIFTLNNPYNTNITWFKDSNPISDATSQVLEVTEAGVYTVSGAPDVCPDYIVNLGVDLPVIINTNPNVCNILSVSEPQINVFSFHPNPANSIINIISKDQIDTIKIYDVSGELLNETTNTNIDVSYLISGLYFIKVSVSGKTSTKKFLKM
jgi:hypothetical protein